jgi:hypothetical protein
MMGMSGKGRKVSRDTATTPLMNSDDDYSKEAREAPAKAP